jgi:hypothetical protein
MAKGSWVGRWRRVGSPPGLLILSLLAVVNVCCSLAVGTDSSVRREAVRVEPTVHLTHSLSGDAQGSTIDVSMPPYSAEMNGTDQRNIFARAVDTAVATGQTIYVPGPLRVDTFNHAGPIVVRGRLKVVGSGVASIDDGGSGPARVNGSLFQIVPGGSLELDISIHGPPIDTVPHVITIGIEHLGGSGGVTVGLGVVIDGFSYGVLARWPSGSTEGVVDVGAMTSAGSDWVADPHANRQQTHKVVQGTGIPSGTTVVSTSPKVGLRLSHAATVSGSTSITIGGSPFSRLGAAAVTIGDGASIAGNGGDAVMVQGRGSLNGRNFSIPYWGSAGSNQYHGIYVHTGVTVDLSGVTFGTTPGTGYAYQTYHQTGPPDYVHIANAHVSSGAFLGFLTNPQTVSTLANITVESASTAFDVWGTATLANITISSTTRPGVGQISAWSDSSYAAVSVGSVDGAQQSGINVRGVKAVDTTRVPGSSFSWSGSVDASRSSAFKVKHNGDITVDPSSHFSG